MKPKQLLLKIPHAHGRYLPALLRGLPLEDCRFEVAPGETEAYQSADMSPLFPDSHMSGARFRQRIEAESYLIFLHLRCFPAQSDTGEPLFELLLFDCSYIELYSPHDEFLVLFRENAARLNFALSDIDEKETR